MNKKLRAEGQFLFNLWKSEAYYPNINLQMLFIVSFELFLNANPDFPVNLPLYSLNLEK